MGVLVDKLILLCGCAIWFAIDEVSLFHVIALLTAVTVGALNSYFGEKFSRYGCVIFLVLCAVRQEFLAFLPLIVYDCVGGRSRTLPFLWVLPLALSLSVIGGKEAVRVFLFCLVAMLLRVRSLSAGNIRREYREYQDSTKEISQHLEDKNKELMEKQDYEVRLATLNERNRIAREIHDNVGHMLSRSLLQVGALRVINQAPAVEEGLSTIKDTLSDAMDSIRKSVHNLHDDSIDLRLQLEAALRQFTFCPIRLDFDAGEMDKSLQYCMIAIVREALSNIARHSNATQASITVREHPALYQLIVQDNGTRPPGGNHRGIGLRGMEERVNAFDGIFLAEYTHGFRLFIAVPKKPETGRGEPAR